MAQLTVSVVTENDALRKNVQQRLEKAKVKVLAGASGVEASNYADYGGAELTILDQKLADMNGVQACRNLKTDKTTALKPVILLIRQKIDKNVAIAIKAGASAVVAYDELDNLVAIAQRVLDEATWIKAEGSVVDFYLPSDSAKTMYRGQITEIGLSGMRLTAPDCPVQATDVIDVKASLKEEAPIVGRADVQSVTTTGESRLISISWQSYRKGDKMRLEKWLQVEEARQVKNTTL